MTRIITSQFTSFSNRQTSTKKAFNFQSLTKNAISANAQKMLKGGDGEEDEEDILIEDVIGG